MMTLLKKLLNRRNESVTFIMLEEDKPENPTYHSIKPLSVFLLLLSFSFGLFLLISLILYITPLGNMIYDQTNRETRQAVIEINQRMAALRDSLYVRDRQLSDIKAVLAQGSDTIFTIQPIENLEEFYRESSRITISEQEFNFGKLDPNQIIYSRNLKMIPDFPVAPPVEGSITRPFLIERNHFGVDIASSEGAPAKVVADGVITSADWTINSGFVLHVHHGNGYVSIYKHLSNIHKRKGDIIFKGDVLGNVGRSGVLTSGPHIHFELWKDGIALDPYIYLTNLSEVN